MKLSHLSQEDHLRLAELLNRVQDNLKTAIEIVARVPYTEATMRCQKRIQMKLIDELSNAWDAAHEYRSNPYQAVGYIISG